MAARKRQQSIFNQKKIHGKSGNMGNKKAIRKEFTA